MRIQKHVIQLTVGGGVVVEEESPNLPLSRSLLSLTTEKSIKTSQPTEKSQANVHDGGSPSPAASRSGRGKRETLDLGRTPKAKSHGWHRLRGKSASCSAHIQNHLCGGCKWWPKSWGTKTEKRFRPDLSPFPTTPWEITNQETELEQKKLMEEWVWTNREIEGLLQPAGESEVDAVCSLTGKGYRAARPEVKSCFHIRTLFF